ncbi:Autoinducer 2 sensor kinase/phosphatase LuxQ [Thiorhodovibrio winogradskyi]|uniref:histidine kinase n=1 Tax=Thiorhodovibrio winogradskyi TaxID=77007 RepID=A0ABZ0SHV6_9GAMM|nr:PAS domain S-box protein [Thiorhodovibrio winogradskyi]
MVIAASSSRLSTDYRAQFEHSRQIYQHLLKVLESTTDAFFEVNSEFRLLYINRTGLQAAGFSSSSEVVGRSLWDVFPEAVGTRFQNECLRALNEHIPVEFEAYYAPHQHWYEVHAYPSERSLCVYFRIINERKAAKEQLLASEGRFRSLFEQAGDAILIADEQGRYTDANPAACAMLGYTREELLQMSVAELAVPTETWTLTAQWNDFTTQGAQSGEFRLRRKDGSLIMTEYCAVANVVPGQHMSVLRDISARKKAEQRLLEDTRHALAASSAKSAFLANMSHEIRTPLNGVVGMLSLLESTQLTPEQADYVQQARQSSERLTRLLSDILDLSRVEAGHLVLSHENFDFCDCMRSLEQLFAPAARQKGIGFCIDLDPEIPRRVMGDPIRVHQIIGNLIGNAIKFTHHGRVSLTVRWLGHGRGQDALVFFSVRDTGSGIPAEQLDHLFEPFAQVENVFTRTHDGVGLGLSIVRSLLKLMRGSLCIGSEPGKGTEFTLSIPFGSVADAACEPPPGIMAATDLLQGLDVLVADDEPVNRLVAKRLLEKSGSRVHAVSDGFQALDALRDQRYDLLLLDLRMPGLDGISTATAIREGQAGKQNRTLPIIALTAHAMTGDRERFLAAGMDAYAPKPIDLAQLREAIGLALVCRNKEKGTQQLGQ